jgi:DNA-binding NarL/FixJ family response regulator
MKATHSVTRAHLAVGAAPTVEPDPGRAMPLKVTSLGPPCRRTSEKIRILIADGHPIFRDGLRRVLETQPDFIVVGEAANGAEALRLASELKPDVMLFDFGTSELSGLDVLHELGRAGIDVKTMLLAAGINKTEQIKSLRLGARGIVMKETPTHLLLKSIRTVATGGYWVGRETVSDLVQALAQSETIDRDPAARKWSLTRRELEILAHVVAGYANKDIARKCAISEDTVKHHLTNIFDKTGVSNRLELALFAIHHRLVDDPLTLT